MLRAIRDARPRLHDEPPTLTFVPTFMVEVSGVRRRVRVPVGHSRPLRAAHMVPTRLRWSCPRACLHLRRGGTAGVTTRTGARAVVCVELGRYTSNRSKSFEIEHERSVFYES